MKKFLFFLAIALFSSFSLANDLENYEKALNSNKNALLIFSTEWCGYCTKLKNDLNKIDTSKLTICIIDADENVDLKRLYKVHSYPTSILIKNKKEVSRKTGYSKEDYKRWINRNVSD